jgi:hypothetical protein
MQKLSSILIIVVMICLAGPGPVPACTLDTKGTGVGITCSSSYMESHTINADGTTSIKFHGQCYYDQGEYAWNKHYYVTATWDGTQAREVVRIAGENKYGTVVSTCPSNPWLDKVACQKKSLSGAAFSDYQITGATTYPLTMNAITDAQRAQLKAELAEKQKEASCATPVIVSPAPAKGMTYKGSANFKVEIKHAPGYPPKDWEFFWAPPTKDGEWPASPTKQTMTLSNLHTSGGSTTGTFSSYKLGNWSIQSKVYFPSYCNKGNYAIPVISFKIREKTMGDAIMEQKMKNLPKKTIDIPTPGPGPGPEWKQQNLQQQKLLQQQQLQQQNLQQQQLR